MNRRQVVAGLAAGLALPARAEWQAVAARPVIISGRTRDGAIRSIADYAGKPVLLHFWASWCATCRTEFPALDAVQRDMGDALHVLAISVDLLGWPVIDKTAESLDLKHLTLLHDLNRDAAKALDITVLPTTLMLDAEGREVARHKGTVEWGTDAERARLKRLVGG